MVRGGELLMSFLTVRHSTVYRYSEPVGLGEHRMMFRPRESHDLRLIRTHLAITPQPAHLRWLHDPFDNSVAVATFEGTTLELRFESAVMLLPIAGFGEPGKCLGECRIIPAAREPGRIVDHT